MDDDLLSRLALQQKRRIAGRKGAAARWGNRPGQGGNHGTQPGGQGGNHGSDGGWFELDIRNQTDDTTNPDDGVVDLYIYDEIGWFGTEPQDLVDRLADVDADTINVHINSPGGSVFDGIAIYNVLAGHSAEVNVKVDGLAASSASIIAMAGDTVTMARYSTLMIHDAWGVCGGNAEDMRQMAGLLDKTSNNLAGVYADRAGGKVDDWRALMRAESWFSAQEAVDAGLADKLAPARNANSDDDDDGDDGVPAARVHDLSRFRYQGRADAPQPAIPGQEPAAPDPPAGGPTVDLAALRAGLDQAPAPHPPRIDVAAMRQQLQEAE